MEDVEGKEVPEGDILFDFLPFCFVLPLEDRLLLF